MKLKIVVVEIDIFLHLLIKFQTIIKVWNYDSSQYFLYGFYLVNYKQTSTIVVYYTFSQKLVQIMISDN